MPEPDAASLAVFLTRYAAECDAAGVNPLPVREQAALLELLAAEAFEPSALLDGEFR
jgi:hypothetical protein